jgi:methionine-rich copper-binding protein CopC
MLRIISIAYIFAFFFGATFPLHAAETSTELRVKTVNVLDSKKIRMNFSDGIDMTSVVLKISKQSDNSSIAIAKLQAVQDTPDSVDVILEEDLEE